MFVVHIVIVNVFSDPKYLKLLNEKDKANTQAQGGSKRRTC